MGSGEIYKYYGHINIQCFYIIISANHDWNENSFAKHRHYTENLVLQLTKA